jgi:hypothetical protein
MLNVSLQQIFTLTPSVLSQYLKFAEEILYEVLPMSKRHGYPCPEMNPTLKGSLHSSHSITHFSLELLAPLMAYHFALKYLMTQNLKTRLTMGGSQTIASTMFLCSLSQRYVCSPM